MRFAIKYLFRAAALLFICVTAFCGGGQTKHASNYKTPEQIHAEINRLNSVEHIDHSFEKNPLYFGVDMRNELRMVIIRECRIKHCVEKLYFLVYDGVSEKKCRKIQGSALYRIQTNIYIGCEPPYFTPVESVE